MPAAERHTMGWSTALICFAALSTASLIAVDASDASRASVFDMDDSIIPEQQLLRRNHPRLVQETDDSDSEDAGYSEDEAAAASAITDEADAEGYTAEAESDYEAGDTYSEADSEVEDFRSWYNNASDAEKQEAGSAIEAAIDEQYDDGSGYGNDYSSSCDCSCHNTTSYACTEWPKEDESATSDERCGTNDGCFGMGTFCYTGNCANGL